VISTHDLQELVQRWLPLQRWFAGKGRRGTVALRPLTSLGDQVTVWIADVVYEGGDRERYHLPLAEHLEPVATLEHVLLGTATGEGGEVRYIYDALHDKDVTPEWLTGIRDQEDRPPLRFQRFADSDALPVGESSLVLTAEQSNTSLKYADIAILKVFRRLQPGVNPDIEIGEALTARGARHVPRLLGAVTAELDAEPYALAILQEYMTTATDGWELAKTSVRDLFAEADLHAEEAGGDFAGEAHRLGTAVAEVHADLADAFGVFPAEDLRARADAMTARLRTATEVVPQLEEIAPRLRLIYQQFAEAASEIELQRIHGDLHLGQALRTSHRWVLIDFEGEPMAALAERRRPDSTLRDVAGMLRSFDYAGHHRAIEAGFEPQLAYRAREWTERNCAAFCAGYAEVTGTDPREHDIPLRAFEADKAVYEAVYEARNRPSWLAIPLGSLTRLADPESVR
jgi:maltokinase